MALMGRDAAIDAAWTRASRLGPSSRRRLAAAWGHIGGRLPSMNQWRDNVRIATGRAPSAAETRVAAESWLRNLLESITLEHWTPADIDSAVLISDDDLERLLGAHSTRGAVGALGHLGSWDLAGAWACRRGLPVTSVAERLTDARFGRFLDARAAMGMRIHTLDDPSVTRALLDDVAAGRFVCLLADRDLTGGGARVRWPTPAGGVPVSVPVGPALVARRTGAALLPIRCHYEGERMRIIIGEEIAHRPGRDGLAAMMGEVVVHLAAGVTHNPTDWHVLGRFFRA